MKISPVYCPVCLFVYLQGGSEKANVHIM